MKIAKIIESYYLLQNITYESEGRESILKPGGTILENRRGFNTPYSRDVAGMSCQQFQKLDFTGRIKQMIITGRLNKLPVIS